MKFALLLLLSLGALAQETEAPHETFQKAKALGLSAKTIDQLEPLLERAIQGWQDRDPRNPEFAQTLTMLGMVREFQADLEIQALRANVEPLYRRALAVYDRSLTPPGSADLALTLELQARVLNSIGQVEDATPLSERALAIRKLRVRELQEGAPQTATAFKPGNGISAPVAVSKTEPEYTNDARFLNQQGTVVLQLVVDQQGRPQNVSLVRSLGFGLDENAAQAVRTWRFRPGVSGGEPVPTIVNIEVNFRLL